LDFKEFFFSIYLNSRFTKNSRQKLGKRPTEIEENSEARFKEKSAKNNKFQQQNLINFFEKLSCFLENNI